MNIEQQIFEMWDALAESRQWCTEEEYNQAFEECRQCEIKLRANHGAPAVNSAGVTLSASSGVCGECSADLDQGEPHYSICSQSER